MLFVKVGGIKIRKLRGKKYQDELNFKSEVSDEILSGQYYLKIVAKLVRKMMQSINFKGNFCIPFKNPFGFEVIYLQYISNVNAFCQYFA